MVLNDHTFLHSWKMAKAMDTTNEKKDSWRALKAFRPSTPRASGIRVMAFRRTNTMMGMTIFFNLDLRADDLQKLKRYYSCDFELTVYQSTFSDAATFRCELNLQAQLVIVDVLWRKGNLCASDRNIDGNIVALNVLFDRLHNGLLIGTAGRVLGVDESVLAHLDILEQLVVILFEHGIQEGGDLELHAG